jgi:hypothetical protein
MTEGTALLAFGSDAAPLLVFTKRGWLMGGFGRIVAATLLAGLCSGTLAAPAEAQAPKQETYPIIARGPTRLLENWTCWHGDCSFANCNARMVREPRQGNMQVRVGDTTIPRTGGKCAGQPTKGLNLTYVPRAGARGADEIIIRITADNGGNYLKRYLIVLP